MEIPEGWKKLPIGKICDSIVPGRNKPKVFDGDIPWVTTPEIQGRYIPSKIQRNYVSEIEINKSGGKTVPEGSVIIAAVGELGLTAIAKCTVVLNQQLHAFICPKNIHNEFIAYYLETQTQYMESVASKTTIPYMNKTNCESIPIAFPPFPEQKRIAEILSTWDRAIETVKKLIKNSQAQKRALMQQLLTGKKRFTDFGNVEWRPVRLKDIADVQTSNVDKKSDPDEIPIQLCNYTDVYYNAHITGDLEFMAATATQREIDKFTLKQGDVIITKDSEKPDDIAVPAMVDEDFEGLLCGYHLALIRPYADRADGAFLSTLFSLKHTQYYFFTRANGATRFGLTIDAIRDAEFRIPDVLEQRKIASALREFELSIANLTNQLSNLQAGKKALMQQLLTGKRRVKVEKEAAYA